MAIRKRVKEFLRRNHLWGLASTIWFFKRNINNPPLGSIDQILEKYSAWRGDVFFVQIGSHEGADNDPLVRMVKRNNWPGLLVEPMKYLFDRLRSNYSGQHGLIFENSAISDSDGEKNFYYLKASEEQMSKWPTWYTQLGSFMPEIILRHECRIPDIKKYIISTKVNCLTFSSLLTKHNIKKVDLICIDTEGFDYKIIKTIDLLSAKPDIIIFEYIHLSDGDYRRCTQYLKRNGFRLFRDSPNIAAVSIPLSKHLLI